jgi:hypothetical protein
MTPERIKPTYRETLLVFLNNRITPARDPVTDEIMPRRKRPLRI